MQKVNNCTVKNSVCWCQIVMFKMGERNATPFLLQGLRAATMGLFYLIFLLLISRHVIIHISACALDGQDAIANGRDHV